MSEKVFHGASEMFDAETANPKPNRRINERGEVIFDEESFHATPHKWIALAYTYIAKPIEGLGVDAFYGMGVDLYSNKKEVAIYGVGSLEETLDKLYGSGGYVYHFDHGDFIYKDGLGSQEVISTRPTQPILMERVDNPVKAMQELGVTFHFVDLSLADRNS
jgi:hypothetical protein